MRFLCIFNKLYASRTTHKKIKSNNSFVNLHTSERITL